MAINMISEAETVVKVKVVGIGGAGINVIRRMDPSEAKAVTRVAVDTNAECVTSSDADIMLQLGETVTKGLGTGGHAEIGTAVARDRQSQLQKMLENTDLVFIAAGMGGGTGSGAAPVVAEIAKEMGILTIAIVTKPFGFEGRNRMETANLAVEELKRHADAVIIVRNDNLKYASDEKLTFRNAFLIADDVLSRTLGGIIDVIQKPAYINSDFADISTILRGSGQLHIGLAGFSGSDRLDDLIREISHNRLLDTSVDGAKGVLLCVTASQDVDLDTIEQISGAVQQAADPDANIIFGMDFREDMETGISVMLLAAGI